MTPAEKYTAAAYLVVFVGVLAYVLIIATKLQRLQRELSNVVDRLREREDGRPPAVAATAVPVESAPEQESAGE